MDKYSKEYLGTRQHIEDMAMVQAAIGFESKPKKMMETKAKLYKHVINVYQKISNQKQIRSSKTNF